MNQLNFAMARFRIEIDHIIYDTKKKLDALKDEWKPEPEEIIKQADASVYSEDMKRAHALLAAVQAHHDLEFRKRQQEWAARQVASINSQAVNQLSNVGLNPLQR